MDAPFHVDHKGMSVEMIPCERAMGEAIWLDLSAVSQPGMLFEPADLELAESETGDAIRAGDVVLVHTGWLTPEMTRGVKSYIEDAPAFSRAAGEWLRARRIKAFGMDLPTPDAHGAADLPIHMNFLRPRSIGLPEDQYILIFENLVRINLIVPTRFFFVGLPLPLRGASGSPVRAVAIWD